MHICALKFLHSFSSLDFWQATHRDCFSCRQNYGISCLRAVSEGSVHRKNGVHMTKDTENAKCS